MDCETAGAILTVSSPNKQASINYWSLGCWVLNQTGQWRVEFGAEWMVFINLLSRHHTSISQQQRCQCQAKSGSLIPPPISLAGGKGGGECLSSLARRCLPYSQNGALLHYTRSALSRRIENRLTCVCITIVCDDRRGVLTWGQTPSQPLPYRDLPLR